MVKPTRPPANGFVAAARRVYNPLGFSKGYNFVLFFIFGVGMFGFVLARFPYLNFRGVYCSGTGGATMGALPGECYYYLKPGRYQVGIIMHLACVLPATVLALLQFVPAIRHKAMLFHRINGYLTIALSLAGTVGALMITDKAFGGGLDIQAAAGTLAIMFTTALVMAYINIKKLQIEQHRAWMLRAWYYAGVILTTRIILVLGAMIGSKANNMYVGMLCAKIDFMMQRRETVLAAFPGCAPFYSGQEPLAHVAVHASNPGANVAEVTAAFNATFGMALWLALVLHAVGIEIYLHLTPAEALRLRNISYQRQVAAGMRHPGNAGLTAQRLGDAPDFVPDAPERKSSADKFEPMRYGPQSYSPVHSSV
ncbi:hypothetical protein Micbo1qcDRAFT_221929 [Microdochium bolleyi]|uniref:Microtubule associated protein n=1 Tax=Microdochium bolleyi TaxID=196109 RepID=A0A136IL82_9PEZI|nr:hypothetical protein Micbo1qcDRAFT_221929 [Microdochium bolleyi]